MLGGPNEDSTALTRTAQAHAADSETGMSAFKQSSTISTFSNDRAGRRVLSIHVGWKFVGLDYQREYAGISARLELVIERKVGR
jgi:hypothetical protein